MAQCEVRLTNKYTCFILAEENVDLEKGGP